MLHDLRHALRRLRRSPGSSALVVLMLTIGLGASAAVFTVLDPLVIRSLPVREPGRLVAVQSIGTLGTNESWWSGAVATFRTADRVFAGVAAANGPTEAQIDNRGAVETAFVETVTANYFELLGVGAAIGRPLTAEDDEAGRAVGVLAHGFWRRAFAGSPAALGTVLTVGRRQYTVVGVAPDGFHGTTVGVEPDLYVTLPDQQRAWWGRVVARLAPGVSAASAESALEPVFVDVRASSDLVEDSWPQMLQRLTIVPADRGVSALRDRTGDATAILMGITVVLLLVACVNVAHLNLTRAADRRAATGVQVALGASRVRVVRQAVFETGILAAVACLAAFVLAGWAGPILVAALAGSSPTQQLTAGLDTRAVMFVLAALVPTVGLTAVWPAVASSRLDVLRLLRGGTGGQAAGRAGSAWRGPLVVLQVALSVVLLVSATLLIRSVVNLSTHDLGFDDRRVLAVSLGDDVSGRPPGQAGQVLQSLLATASRLPGVESASLTPYAPMTPSEIGVTVRAGNSAETSHTFFTYATPTYFRTLGLTMVDGRGFPEVEDGELQQVVINRTLARRLFGDRSPVGQSVRFVEGNRPPMTIHGVVNDAVYNTVREEQRAFLYVRMPTQVQPTARAVMLIRSTGPDAEGLAGDVAEAIRSSQLGVSVRSASTLRGYVMASLETDRLIGALATAFSVLTLAIVTVGIFGILAMAVTRRRREIGVRMALGATAGRVVRDVAAPMLRLAVVGLLLGLVAAALAGRILSTLLFELDSTDPGSLATGAGVLLLGVLIACYAPARRAIRVDPAVALRHE